MSAPSILGPTGSEAAVLGPLKSQIPQYFLRRLAGVKRQVFLQQPLVLQPLCRGSDNALAPQSLIMYSISGAVKRELIAV